MRLTSNSTKDEIYNSRVKAQNEKRVKYLKSIVKESYGCFCDNDFYPIADRFSKHNRLKKMSMADKLVKIDRNNKFFINGQRYDTAKLFDTALLNMVNILPSEISVNGFIDYVFHNYLFHSQKSDTFLFYAADFIRESSRFRLRNFESVYENKDLCTKKTVKLCNRLFKYSFSITVECIAYFQTYFAELDDEERDLLIYDIEQRDVMTLYDYIDPVDDSLTAWEDEELYFMCR